MYYIIGDPSNHLTACLFCVKLHKILRGIIIIKTLTISFRFYLGGNEAQIYSEVDKMPFLKT